MMNKHAQNEGIFSTQRNQKKLFAHGSKEMSANEIFS